MKAALGTLPGDDERWAYEIKWDGYRTLAFVDDGSVRLQSSHLLDVTAKYPELSDLPDGVHAESAILDGELVVLDDEGRPRFELLQVHKRQAAVSCSTCSRSTATTRSACRTRIVASCSTSSSNRRQLVGLGPPDRRWRSAARRHLRAGARGRDGEAARLDLRARQAFAELAQGQEPPARRGRDRRIHPR